jgi:hypothetical protein
MQYYAIEIRRTEKNGFKLERFKERRQFRKVFELISKTLNSNDFNFSFIATFISPESFNFIFVYFGNNIYYKYV